MDVGARSVVLSLVLGALLMLGVKDANATKFATPDGVGDGSGWEQAASLVQALASASEGEAIWLSEGTYTNASDPAFTITTNNVKLYGGFTNGMVALGDRDWNAYPTILSGNVTQPNIRRVMTISANATLDGLVISNGISQYGGGIYANGAYTISILNCHIVTNQFPDIIQTAAGAAAYLSGGSVTISNTVFAHNGSFNTVHKGNKGAMGIYANNETLNIVSSLFSNNVPAYPLNVRDGKGGAILLLGTSSLIAEDTIFADNEAPMRTTGIFLGGGAVRTEGCTAVFRDCVFSGNKAQDGGGAVLADNGANVTAENCVFVGNTATDTRGDGGAFRIVNGTLVVSNCTFVANEAQSEGGALAVHAGSMTLVNSILYTNTAGIRGGDIYLSGGSSTISYCRLGDTESSNHFADATGNATLTCVVTHPPMFADYGNGDYHLRSPTGRYDPGTQGYVATDLFPHSPCIDAGSPNLSTGDEPAPHGSRINLGLYGGTAQASKTPATSPVVENRSYSTNVNVAVVRGELVTQDVIANCMLYYGTNATVTNTDTVAVLYPPQQTGTVFSVQLTDLNYATTYYYRWYATNAYGSNWANVSSNFTTGVKTLGGPNNVIHVKSDAPGGETGDCWFNAYQSLGDAAATITTGTNEIWVAAGSYDYDEVVVGSSCSIYGGFTGVETQRSERGLSPVVFIDGKLDRRCLSITGGTVILDGLIMTNGYSTSGAGLSASGTYDLTMRACRIVGCRPSGAAIGLGARFQGGSVFMTNCVLRDNAHPGLYWTTFDGFGFHANGTSVEIHDSTFVDNGRETFNLRNSKAGGFHQIGGSLVVSNSSFVNNATGSDLYGGGGIIEGGATARFGNCEFRGNAVYYYTLVDRVNSVGGALYVEDAGTDVVLENCTFTQNFGSERGGALYVASGTVTVQNCIFWANTCSDHYPGLEGYDIAQAGGTVTLSYSSTSGDPDNPTYIYNSSGVNMDHVATVDPLFAGTNDVHLRSKSGRWDPTLGGGAGDWTNDMVTSPCIDVGDPDLATGDEPSPHGGRINLGRYGRIAQASRSPATAPIVENRFYTTNVNAAVVRGELVTQDVIASCTLYYGTNATVTNMDTSVFVYPPQQTGAVFSVQLASLDYATTYYYRWYATNAYGADWANVSSNFTTGTKPLSGPDNVIHVKPDAVGSDNGENWFDAYPSLADAALAVTAGTNEIWVAAGTYDDAEVVVGSTCSIYGGFTGVEMQRSERGPSLVVFIDGILDRRCLSITGGTVILDNLVMTNGCNASGGGLYASGTYDLTMRSCHVAGGRRPAGSTGLGARFEGGSVFMTNCVFRDNTHVGSYSATYNGFGFYANATSVEIHDSTFEGNGRATWQERSSMAGGFHQIGGSLVVSNTSFVSNGVGSDYYGGAGIIEGGATARFGNCEFRGNAVYYYALADRANSMGGALYVEDATTDVVLENCTFTQNFGSERGGALYVASGTVTVQNCIFWTNTCSDHYPGLEGYDIAQAGGTVTLSYSSTSGDPDNSTYIYNSSGVNMDHVATMDPLFAGTNDVHLRSKSGRWDPTLGGGAGDWTNDRVTSPCIDGGDPASDYSAEPFPNGRRINLGRYGRMPEASRTQLHGTLFLSR